VRSRGRDDVLAYHEAGHAVMAILLGASVDLVAINQHAVTYYGDIDQLNEEHEIMISMGGDIAVRHFIDPKMNNLSRRDRHNIQKALNRKGIKGINRKQIRARLRDRAERLLISHQENSAKVEKLAKVLMECPVLFIDQIQQILPEAHPSKVWPPRTIKERNQFYGTDSSFAFREWINQILPLRRFRNDNRKRVKHRYEVHLYDDRGKKLSTIGHHQDFEKGLEQIVDYRKSNGEHEIFMYDCGTGEYYEKR